MARTRWWTCTIDHDIWSTEANTTAWSIRSEYNSGDRVRLSVRDVGVGLPPQGSDLLFDAFYTTKHGGMGIGLFVIRSIIERHQGRLWAEPNDDGPGATFSFSIPRNAPVLEPSVTA